MSKNNYIESLRRLSDKLDNMTDMELEELVFSYEVTDDEMKALAKLEKYILEF